MKNLDDRPAHAEPQAPEQQAPPHSPMAIGERRDPLAQAAQRVPTPVDAWRASEIALELIGYLKGADAKRD